MRLVLLAATVRATSAALALPSVLTTRGHNATAYVVLGTEHELTLSLREDLCRAILDGEPTANEKREALEMLKDTAGAMRRVLGPDHPDTLHAKKVLKSNEEKYHESV